MARKRAPLISVVIPTFNRAPDLRRALESVRRQTYDRWEILVVDNHSADDTDAVVASCGDPRIHLFKVRNNGVIAVSRNLGIAKAKGDYLAFLDSDDWWLPDKLEKSLACLEHGADVVFHDLWLAHSARQRIHWRKCGTRALQRPVFDDLVVNGNALCTSSVVIRSELVRRLGGFSEDPTLVAWEDYDLWLRISKETERFTRLEVPLGYYWVGGGNTTSAQRTLRNIQRFCERYIAPEVRWRDTGMPAWCHYSYGIAYVQLGQHAAAADHMSRAMRGNLPWTRRLYALLQAVACSGRCARRSDTI